MLDIKWQKRKVSCPYISIKIQRSPYNLEHSNLILIDEDKNKKKKEKNKNKKAAK